MPRDTAYSPHTAFDGRYPYFSARAHGGGGGGGGGGKKIATVPETTMSPNTAFIRMLGSYDVVLAPTLDDVAGGLRIKKTFHDADAANHERLQFLGAMSNRVMMCVLQQSYCVFVRLLRDWHAGTHDWKLTSIAIVCCTVSKDSWNIPHLQCRRARGPDDIPISV